MGVLGDRTTIAYDVVLTDPLPKGLLLKNIKENPDRKGRQLLRSELLRKPLVCTVPHITADSETVPCLC